MDKRPTKKLNLTRTEVYMIILMLNSIIDEFYEELAEISYKDMFDMIDAGNIFSFFEKYRKNGAVHTLMYLYEGTPKIDEFNYIMIGMLGLDYPKKCSIEFKGVNLLLAACMEFYINYEDHKLSYNGETKRRYYWRELFEDFSIVCENMVELIRAEFRHIFRLCNRFFEAKLHRR